jgi:hypothetical protein
MSATNQQARRLVRYGVWLPILLWLAALAVFIFVVESRPKLSGDQGMAEGLDTIAAFVTLAFAGLAVFILVLVCSLRTLVLSRRESIARFDFMSAICGTFLALVFAASFVLLLGDNVVVFQ